VSLRYILLNIKEIFRNRKLSCCNSVGVSNKITRFELESIIRFQFIVLLIDEPAFYINFQRIYSIFM